MDACVDFSAYEAQHVSDVVLVLAGKVGHYIFISTNSVYMSDIPDNSELYSDEEYPSGSQWNAVVDTPLQQKYGWDKRACEEVLVAAHAAGGFPATRLRIPAICGPGDTSYRWFRLHKWLQSGQPVYATNPIGGYCACFSLDVVSAVHATIAAGSIAHGQVYHITQSPASTLPEVIEAMSAGSKTYALCARARGRSPLGSSPQPSRDGAWCASCADTRTFQTVVGFACSHPKLRQLSPRRRRLNVSRGTSWMHRLTAATVLQRLNEILAGSPVLSASGIQSQLNSSRARRENSMRATIQ